MMQTRLSIAALLLLLTSSANATTMFTNLRGLDVDAEGHLHHFDTLIVTGDGKVGRTYDGTEDVVCKCKVINLGGRFLLPGFIDAHGHVTELGLDAMHLDLVGMTSLADLQAALRNYAAAHPQATWIIGAGWNQELWPDKRFPTAADLDSMVSDRPVVLERVYGHAVVANSAAMKAARVTAATPAPPGGRIESGLFVDNARSLIDGAIPQPTDAELDAALTKSQQILLSFGVTSVRSMATSLADWQAFQRAGRAGRLNVRLISYLIGDDAFKALPHPTGWLFDDHLRAVGAKFFADGALGSRGAWLKQPYADKPDTHGLPRHTPAELQAMEERAAAAGFQLATHAIGDAANAEVISIYEGLTRRYGSGRRWSIEHFQIVDPADIPRLAPAGIVASMQPTHQTSDRLMAEKRLGPNRLAGAYAWQSVLKSGAKLAFGTDFPVESPDPFPGLSAAVTRQDIHGQPPGGWMPAERLTFAQALNAYTRGAAYAGFAENKIGALEPGKWADFIIVNRDPATVDPRAPGVTQVDETWVAGKKVWERPPSPSAPERGK
jgi:predicted amidohydrolase YtcJ